MNYNKLNKMKLTITSLILIIFSFVKIESCFSQPVQQVWVRTYDSLPGSSSAMACDSMQNIIVTGSIHLTSGRTDWCTIKYNPSGTQQWVAIYDGIPTSNGINTPTAIGVDQQGNIYVTGYSERSGFGTDDYCTVKYNSNGVQQWVVRYNNGIGSKNDASALAIDIAGNVYITGYSTASGVGYDIVTIKYNPNQTNVKSLTKTITDLGYTASLVKGKVSASKNACCNGKNACCQGKGGSCCGDKAENKTK